MMLDRPALQFYAKDKPLYRIDLVETAGNLGVVSGKPPTVRVIQRNACPECGDTENWIFDMEVKTGACPCGHAWDEGAR